MFSESSLSESLAKFGITESAEIFKQLQNAYGGADRHYHDQTHVAECLAHLSSCEELAVRLPEIEIAIWFHDAVYDTTKGDNEERSADWALSYLLSENVSHDIAERVHSMIVATKTHTPSTDDETLLIDIDLGILGTPQGVFEKYDQSIRREYHWVPEEQYVLGRINVLKSFLDRPEIFRTERFSKKYEATARDNLSRKIAELSEA